MELKAIVLVCSDFDGTATNRNGHKTTQSAFYQSLNVKIGSFAEVKKRILNALLAKFGPFDASSTYEKTDADMFISLEALEFFRELATNERTQIFIISKNDVAYIHALFEYQGFKNEALAKLVINSTGDKEITVIHNLSTLFSSKDSIRRPLIARALVLDDDEKQCNQMVTGITHYYQYKLDKTETTDLVIRAPKVRGQINHDGIISSIYESPKTFKWKEYLTEIREFLSSIATYDREIEDKFQGSTPEGSDDDEEGLLAGNSSMKIVSLLDLKAAPEDKLDITSFHYPSPFTPPSDNKQSPTTGCSLSPRS